MPSRLKQAAALAAFLSSATFASAQATVEWEGFYPLTGPSNTCARLVRTDSDGHFLVSAVDEGLDDDTLVLAKFDASGNRLWATTYNPPGANFCDMADMQVDGAGNLVVAVNSFNSGELGWNVIKVSSGGSVMWVRAADNLEAAQLTLDSLGRIFVVGSAPGHGQDIIVRRISPKGDSVWTRKFNGGGTTDDVGSVIAQDADGNLLVGGYTMNADYVQRLLKFTPEGLLLWTKSTALAGYDVTPVKIIAKASGGCYVASQGKGGPAERGILSEHDAAGDFVWRQSFNISGTGDTQLRDFTLDGSGNLVVVGDADNGVTSQLLIRKIDPTGSHLWQRTYAGEGGFDTATRVVVADDQSIYLLGSTLTDLFSCLVLKYSSAGSRTWAYQYAGSGGYDEGVDAIASGNAVVGLAMSQITEDRESLHIFKLR
jgi:hypothetical protein